MESIESSGKDTLVQCEVLSPNDEVDFLPQQAAWSFSLHRHRHDPVKDCSGVCQGSHQCEDSAILLNGSPFFMCRCAKCPCQQSFTWQFGLCYLPTKKEMNVQAVPSGQKVPSQRPVSDAGHFFTCVFSACALRSSESVYNLFTSKSLRSHYRLHQLLITLYCQGSEGLKGKEIT